MENHRLKTRKYREVKLGDTVRLLLNAKLLKKKRSVFGLIKSMNLRIQKIYVGKLYYLEGHPHGVLRSD